MTQWRSFGPGLQVVTFNILFYTNFTFLSGVVQIVFHPQITAASASTNLVTPTRTGAPHQPMMSPRTAWRRALQEHGNRIPARQKSIIIGYIFKGFYL